MESEMKKILINEDNKEKIQEILLKSQGKAKERRMTFESLMDGVKIAIARANWILVKQRKGLCFTYSLNEKMANSYKYKYDADVVEMEWTSKGWVLTNHERKTFWPTSNNTSNFHWRLTEEEKLLRIEEIKQGLYKSFIEL
jgi:hypothetical protein